jgi:hypothetical protein
MLASGEPLKCSEETTCLRWRLSSDGRRGLLWGLGRDLRGRWSPCGGLSACFFAEASEFLFVEAFLVFLEYLACPVEIHLLDKDVPPAAEGASRAAGATHARDACLGQASFEQIALDLAAGRGEELEHPCKISESARRAESETQRSEWCPRHKRLPCVLLRFVGHRAMRSRVIYKGDSVMRYIKLICLTLVAVGVLVIATEGVASALPQHIYKVEGAKLEANEKKEIRAKLKPGTEFTIKGKGVLGAEWIIKCPTFKLNTVRNPMIVGGTPGGSEKEFFEPEGCKATVGGSACSSVEGFTSETNDELVTILLPVGKAGKLANWFVPDNEEKKLISFKLNKCGIFGTQMVEIAGTTAASVVPEGGAGLTLTWVWKANEEITEIERQNGEKFKPKLTSLNNLVTFNGEVEVELVTKENWGAF